ncbi:L-histidine N(alpha)-methyltransferase [soil metagenome]
MNDLLEKNKVFAEDVKKGLSSQPKFLLSKYFYNQRGDELFQDIMNLEEYYLTRCEYEILNLQKEDIISGFGTKGLAFNLIELGAGDGYKTKVLIDFLQLKEKKFKYIPIDISATVLENLNDDLIINFPGIEVQPIQGDYFKVLKELSHKENTLKVLLFLGSNIGNFSEVQATAFLKALAENMTSGDKLLIGFDLKKDPQVIANAYNDKEGKTRDFNLNLLQRINKELGGNFMLKNFKHYPTYDPSSGQAKSFLVSNREQTVFIEALGQSYNFSPWETIFMEVSQKYDVSDIRRLASLSGFIIEQMYFDQKSYFVDSLWKLK